MSTSKRLTDFEAEAAKEKNLTLAEYRERYVTLPCVCDAHEGVAWACIRRTEDCILHHLVFHMPSQQQLNQLSLDELREATGGAPGNELSLRFARAAISVEALQSDQPAGDE